MQVSTLHRRRALALGAGLVCLFVAAPAAAFCGFYVKDREVEDLKSRASRAVLLRDGTTTVLSMQSSYEGPAEDFALIVPVPSPIGPEDVRTLDAEVFERLDELTSPRLVEYWEQEPVCPSRVGVGFGTIGYGYGGGGIGGVVTIEARFAVGEYDVVVLGADESEGLVRWLEQEGYELPRGAEAVLRPYVERGMRFFAAKVDVERVRFENGRALLSPLRIRYDSEQLALPIRLGTLASPGKQDLVVHVISREGRYEVANRPNVQVPTNLEVRAATKGRFRSFYESLLDHVWAEQPTSVVTEYAWSATSCDPCPGPTMSADDITTFGGDVISGAQEQSFGRGFAIERPEVYEGPLLPRERIIHALQARTTELFECVESPVRVGLTLTVGEDGSVGSSLTGGDERTRACLGRALGELSVSRAGLRAGLVRAKTGLFLNQRVRRYLPSAQGFTVTRLRARYGREAPDDLIFRRAPAIVGGIGEPGRDGALDTAVRQGTSNTFQARYAVLHRWRGNRCDDWMSGGWGGPPDSGDDEVVHGAPGLLPRRRPVSLRRLLRGPLPRLGAARMSMPEDAPLAFLQSTLVSSPPPAMLRPWPSAS